MSQWEKLMAKILKVANDLRFDELKKVLEANGYAEQSPSGGSSHHTFRKRGCDSITIPKRNPVKKEYVRQVRDAILNAEVKDDSDD